MSALAFNPMVDGLVSSPDPGVPTDSNGGATQGAVMGPSPANTSNAAAVQGTGKLTGTHNAPLHVAFLGLIALAVIVGFNLAGFHVIVAGRVGR